ncbi:tumor necrosis factor ligand superfamily member 12 [Xenopus laevis]|uniref:Tumor necrosis factor ligand superfamily member 12 n=1 Tax=Xenopus laevis TaxID=8355 RepID=A0A8J0UTP3_XENLA|nr:tumor necrosis factor ligand superfamily member 12 [Xenopus laevis]
MQILDIYITFWKSEEPHKLQKSKWTMTHWRKKGSGRRTLLLLVLLALVLGGTALCLASVNLLLTTTGWGKTLRQGQVLLHQDLPYQQLDTETQIYYQNVWEKQQYLYQKLREKSRPRRAAKDKKKRKPPLYAAHYEVRSPKGWGQTEMNADKNGTILHWVEVPLNSSSPIQYHGKRGEFIVNQRGLYYLYCQVHFNEARSVYIKLDILLDGSLIFRCLQEFSTTAASIHDPKVKTCAVSGLFSLRPNSSLRLRTIPDASLRVDRFLTYFGLFQVH